MKAFYFHSPLTLLRTYPDSSKELEMFSRRELVIEDVMLGTDSGHLADLLHLVGVINVVSKDVGGSGRGRRHPSQHVEQGGFSSSVVT